MHFRSERKRKHWFHLGNRKAGANSLTVARLHNYDVTKRLIGTHCMRFNVSGRDSVRLVWGPDLWLIGLAKRVVLIRFLFYNIHKPQNHVMHVK